MSSLFTTVIPVVTTYDIYCGLFTLLSIEAKIGPVTINTLPFTRCNVSGWLSYKSKKKNSPWKCLCPHLEKKKKPPKNKAFRESDFWTETIVLSYLFIFFITSKECVLN